MVVDGLDEASRDGRNELAEIIGRDVGRWPDWLLEGKPRPSPGRLAFSTWKHYGKDDPLLPSGLLGPVRLLKAEN